MVTLSPCLIWQIIGFILPSNEYTQRLDNAGKYCERSSYRRCRFWRNKNRFFRWSSFWSWRVCKWVKLSHLGHRKLARIYWKADAPKRSHCLVRILIQRHNWAIFLRKWARRGRYSQWRSLSGHVERIFVHKNCRGGYWQHLVSTGRHYVSHSRSYTRFFASGFWRSHYQPQSWCRLELGAAIWHRWSIICGVPDNIREAISEIQLHTIDNVLKNWTHRVGYCMASQGSHLNEIIFHY